MNKALFLISALSLFTLHSCTTSSGTGEPKSVVSRFGETRSHNVGENCMSCHGLNGSGTGWFTVAGSVYDSTGNKVLPNATVKLYTGPDGTGNLEALIEVDGLGNFFTTDSIHFGSGIYTGVEGPSATIYMESAITEGSCNSCHGVNTPRISAE